MILGIAASRPVTTCWMEAVGLSSCSSKYDAIIIVGEASFSLSFEVEVSFGFERIRVIGLLITCCGVILSLSIKIYSGRTGEGQCSANTALEAEWVTTLLERCPRERVDSSVPAEAVSGRGLSSALKYLILIKCSREKIMGKGKGKRDGNVITEEITQERDKEMNDVICEMGNV